MPLLKLFQRCLLQHKIRNLQLGTNLLTKERLIHWAFTKHVSGSPTPESLYCYLILRSNHMLKPYLCSKILPPPTESLVETQLALFVIPYSFCLCPTVCSFLASHSNCFAQVCLSHQTVILQSWAMDHVLIIFMPYPEQALK